MSDTPTPAADYAMHCLMALDSVPNCPVDQAAVAVAVAQVHATLAIAEAIDKLAKVGDLRG